MSTKMKLIGQTMQVVLAERFSNLANSVITISPRMVRDRLEKHLGVSLAQNKDYKVRKNMSKSAVRR